MKNPSDNNNNNNYKKCESPEYFPTADQNNNESDFKKNFGDSSFRSPSKLRNHQMQQLLQQHVFTQHQVRSTFKILKISMKIFIFWQ